MPITGITIDFWQTLYDSSMGEERNAARSAILLEEIEKANGPQEQERFGEAYRNLWSFFDHHWLGSQRTPTSREMVEEVLRSLECVLSEEGKDRVVECFEGGILDYSPKLLPGVREGLDYLSGIGPLAIISDTAFSPGTILRKLMERDGIIDYFTGFVFSDETGVAKPHADAFYLALEQIDRPTDRSVHIGDIERTDIAGAKGVGMKAVLYRNEEHLHKHAKYAEKETKADAILSDWKKIPEIIRSLA